MKNDVKIGTGSGKPVSQTTSITDSHKMYAGIFTITETMVPASTADERPLVISKVTITGSPEQYNFFVTKDKIIAKHIASGNSVIYPQFGTDVAKRKIILDCSAL